MRSFDLIGAVTPAQHNKQKAAASGQRAVTAAQRIAKTAPRLSAAILKVGQKALAAGGVAPTTATAPKSSNGASSAASSAPAATTTPVASAAPPSMSSPRPGPAAPTRAQQQAQARVEQMRKANQAYFQSTKLLAAAHKTHVGDDAPADDASGEVADIYSQLADAASAVADFIAEAQDLQVKVPSSTQLSQEGLGTISQLQNWFATPLESALQGDQQAKAKIQDLYDVLQDILSKRDDPNRPWPWSWFANANAYLKVHPPVVATVTVSPSSTTIAPGVRQAFTASVVDASGAPVSSPVSWTVSPSGATIDASGNFVTQTPGTYTITATTASGSGGATATVQAGATSAATSLPTSPTSPTSGTPPSSGGGYDGGGYGGGDFDGGGGSYEDPAGASGGDGSDRYDDYDPYAGEPSSDVDADPFADEDQLDGQGALAEESYDRDVEVGGVDASRRRHGEHERRARHGKEARTLATTRTSTSRPDSGRAFDLVGASGDDSWLSIHTPNDYRDAATQLKASADNLNLTAASEPGWKAVYDTATRLYDQYHDIGFFSSLTKLTDSTWRAIADAQRRIDEFGAQMRAQGKKVVEPEHDKIDNSVTGPAGSGALDTLQKHWPWFLAGGAALAVGVPLLTAAIPVMVGRHIVR